MTTRVRFLSLLDSFIPLPPPVVAVRLGVRRWRAFFLMMSSRVICGVRVADGFSFFISGPQLPLPSVAPKLPAVAALLTGSFLRCPVSGVGVDVGSMSAVHLSESFIRFHGTDVRWSWCIADRGLRYRAPQEPRPLIGGTASVLDGVSVREQGRVWTEGISLAHPPCSMT